VGELSQIVASGAVTVSSTSYLHHGNVPLWEVGSQNGLQVYAHDPLGNVLGLVGNIGTSANPLTAYFRTNAYGVNGIALRGHPPAVGRLSLSGRVVRRAGRSQPATSRCLH
jgi:hypothetical protein